MRIIIFRFLLLVAAMFSMQFATAQNNWNERSNHDLKLYFHEGESRNVSGLLDAWSRSKPGIYEKLKIDLPYVPKIFIVIDQDEFERATRGMLPHWAHGVSFPRAGQIVLKSPSFSKDIDTFHRTAIHELVHLMIANKGGEKVPRWFNEGLAQVLSGETIGKPMMPVSRAFWTGKLVSLSSVDFVDKMEKANADLAYLASAHATQFFTQQFGWEAVRELLDNLKIGLLWEDALFNAVGMDQAGFEAMWHEDLNSSYKWLVLLDTPAYLLFGSTLLILIAGFAVYRRRKRIYKKWEAEDDPYAGTI